MRLPVYMLSVAIVVGAPLSNAQAPPIVESERPYVRALIHTWSAALVVPVTVEWCAKQFPDSNVNNQFASYTWRAKFGPLLADLNNRMNELMRGSGLTGPDQIEAEVEEARRTAYEKFDEEMASSSKKTQKQGCKDLPASLAGEAFDLELKHAAELKIIRAHGVEVERPKKE